MALLHQLASRLLGPEIADRIQWKRKRGHPKSPPHDSPSDPYKYDRPSRIRMAKLAVRIIQKIWRKHYDGKWQRRLGDIDAYEIAALYFAFNGDINEEDVRRKPSGRRKKKE
jgi:hypothetical protein